MKTASFGLSFPGAIAIGRNQECVLAYTDLFEPGKPELHRFQMRPPRLPWHSLAVLLASLWLHLRISAHIYVLLAKKMSWLEVAISVIITLTILALLLGSGGKSTTLSLLPDNFLGKMLKALLPALLLLLFYRFLGTLIPGHLFRKHAAEHRVVHLLDRGLPLTLENARTMPNFHPRCSFNLIGLTVLLGTLLAPWLPLWAAFLVGGLLALELQKWPVVSWVGYPFQALTLEEPREEDLELALLAARSL